MIKFLMNPKISVLEYFCLLFCGALLQDRQYWAALFIAVLAAIAHVWWEEKQLRADKV